MRNKSTIHAASAIWASQRSSALTLHAHTNQYNLPRVGVRAMSSTTLWIDTDCGFDDLCAVSLLQDYSRMSSLKVAYISTVNGMTDPVVGAGVMNKILRLSGYDLDIACGVDSNVRQKHLISDTDWGYQLPDQHARYFDERTAETRSREGSSEDLGPLDRADQPSEPRYTDFPGGKHSKVVKFP